MSGLSPEDIESLKARDHRFREIELGIEVESELRQNRPLFILMAALREDAERAMAEFAHADLGNISEIQGLQARVFRFRYAFETYDAIVTRGQFSQQSVVSEDQIEQ